MTALRRALLVVSFAVPAALLCGPGIASAHVTVEPSTAPAGSETDFAFRVPTEKDRASTVKVVLALPEARPLPAVAVEPVPGWRVRVTTHDLDRPVQTDDGPVTRAASRITWTAAGLGNAIGPGQFQRFVISAGPLPDAGRLVFKVLQYYSDGRVARWIDAPGGSDPPHPAPVVTITSARADAAPDPGGGVDGWIAVAAFAAGLLGLGAGSAALVVARRARRAQR